MFSRNESVKSGDDEEPKRGFFKSFRKQRGGRKRKSKYRVYLNDGHNEEEVKRLPTLFKFRRKSDHRESIEGFESGFVKPVVVLLDGTEVTLPHVELSSKLWTILLHLTAELKIPEQEMGYFSLKMGNDIWIQPVKKIERQLKRYDPNFSENTGIVRLHFGVKYWPKEVDNLSDVTKYHLCCQIKQYIKQATNLFEISDKLKIIFYSYFVQAEIGDFDSEVYSEQGEYLESYIHANNIPNTLRRPIASLHKSYKGLTPSAADSKILQHFKSQTNYGINLQPQRVYDSRNIPIDIGLSPSGISVFQEISVESSNRTIKQKINSFPWLKIQKISFKKKLFCIQISREKHCEDYDTVLVFHCGSYDGAKLLWKNAVEAHRVFSASTFPCDDQHRASSENSHSGLPFTDGLRFEKNYLRTGLYNRLSNRLRRSSLFSFKSRNNVPQYHKSNHLYNGNISKTQNCVHTPKFAWPAVDCNSNGKNGVNLKPDIAFIDDEVEDSSVISEEKEEQIVVLEADVQGKFGFIVTGGSDWGSPVTVSRIAPDSPAAASQKLSQGTIIVQINDLLTLSLTHDQIVQTIKSSAILNGKIVLKIVHASVGRRADVEPRVQYVLLNGKTKAAHDECEKSQSELSLSMHLLAETTDPELSVGFYKMPKENYDYSYKIANLSANESKNRYRDVLPYDETRFTVVDDADYYINASFVNMAIEGSCIVNSYIAAQGPLERTVNDFWLMIWESGTPLIVMLTSLTEKSSSKCYKYWPDSKQTYADICVMLKSEDKSNPTYNLRYFEMCKSNEKRSIIQVQYKSWPDHGVPSTQSGFIEFMNKVRSLKCGYCEPLVVHCSAGIGRTGLFILVETAICLIEANQGVYPFDIVKTMRRYRAHLVQTSSQFLFACKVICDYFFSSTNYSVQLDS